MSEQSDLEVQEVETSVDIELVIRAGEGEAVAEALVPAAPIELTYEERLRKALSNSYIAVEHLKWIVKKYGGDASYVGPEPLKNQLVKTALAHPARASGILRAAQILNQNYPLKGAKFQSYWLPFDEPQRAFVYQLKEELAEIFPGEDAMGQTVDEPDEHELYPARFYSGPGCSFRVVLATFRKHFRVDADTKFRVRDDIMDKYPMFFRKGGIEMRVDVSGLAKCEAFLMAQIGEQELERLGLGAPDGQGRFVFNSPLAIKNRRELTALRHHLGARTRKYKCEPLPGEGGKTEMESYLESNNLPLRDFFRVARMRAISSQQNAQHRHVVKVAAGQYVQAEIEFDFRHEDGYVERHIKVQLTKRGVVFLPRISEAALEFFWECLTVAKGRR